jgi:hypothetical protein
MPNVLTQTIFGQQLTQHMSLHDAIELLIGKNLINVGQLAEMAISKKANVAMCSPCTPNIDLVSGVQIKYATVMKPASSDYYCAYISRNTTAPMCVIISNPMENNKQYFLYIPYSAHQHLTGSCINISFGRDGLDSSSKWWHHQVDSFDALCQLAK